MKCEKCGTEMNMGFAINPDPDDILDGRSIVPQTRTISPDDVQLISVMKCPACGHSDNWAHPNTVTYEKN